MLNSQVLKRLHEAEHLGSTITGEVTMQISTRGDGFLPAPNTTEIQVRLEPSKEHCFALVINKQSKVWATASCLSTGNHRICQPEKSCMKTGTQLTVMGGDGRVELARSK